jgi:2-dehydro-3-deoxygluconokinase
MTASASIVTVGEILLRLSSPPGRNLRNLPRLDAFPAGAEANVARTLARLGHPAAFLTCLPDQPLAHGIADELRRSGVDTGGIAWKPAGRLGTFFVQFADAPRGIEVVYDRAGSCAAAMSPEDLDLPRLAGCRLLHLSGILPALSASCAETARRAVALARGAGARISLDVNHRSRLWSGAAAAAALEPLLASADIVFCSHRDARTLWSCDGEGATLLSQLQGLTPARYIVSSNGAAGAWASLDGSGIRHEPAVPVTILDRLGAGDALASGFLHGLLHGDPGRGLRQGVILAALALTEHGDCPTVDRAELDRLTDAGAPAGVPRR